MQTQGDRPEPRGARLDPVQYLRAIAASAVVLGHVMGMLADLCDGTRCAFARPPIPTGAGVDLFFVISGFIMVVSSKRMFGAPSGPADFMLRRLVRIVPLYWGVTGAKILLSLVLPGAAGFSLAAVVSSLFFFPFDAAGTGEGLYPIVDLGWTLNYEMLFYVLFASFIRFGEIRCVQLVTAALVVLIAVGGMVPGAGALHFWSRPIVLEFAAGMWLAVLYGRGRLRLPAVARWALFLAAGAILGLFVANSVGVATPVDFGRVIFWGVPAIAVMAVAVSGGIALPRPVKLALLILGNASYSLYLTHPFCLLILRRAGMRLAAATPHIVFLLVTLAATMIVAIAVHYLFERPVTTRLTRLLARGGLPIKHVPLVPDVNLTERRVD